eukprot:COSAG03_NODE_5150_length_1330_cov_1.670187_1_plen_64_part_10
MRLRLNDGEDKLSSIQDNTLTPVWHDSFEFDLPGKYGRWATYPAPPPFFSLSVLTFSHCLSLSL